jgi:hypothetical protein
MTEPYPPNRYDRSTCPIRERHFLKAQARKRHYGNKGLPQMDVSINLEVKGLPDDKLKAFFEIRYGTRAGHARGPL